MTRTDVDRITLRAKLGDPSRLDRLSLASRLQAVDEFLWQHARGVAFLVSEFADSSGLKSALRKALVDAAWFHDIGKLTVPPDILSKPGPLEASEWTIVRQHAVVGAEFLAEFRCLADASRLVRHHHERFDGGGYPDGLVGFQIPFGARVVAVADAFHAMTSARSYRPAKAREEACRELQRCSGTQFDPEIVEMFVRLQGKRSGHAGR